jgi:hypothetical protein
MLVKCCKGWRIYTHKEADLISLDLEFSRFWKQDCEAFEATLFYFPISIAVGLGLAIACIKGYFRIL